MRPRIKTYDFTHVRHYVTTKRDGIWATISRDAKGEVAVHTRHPTDITHQLREHPTVQVFASQRWRGPVTWYCEVFAPMTPASQVKSYLADGLLHHLHIEAFASPTHGVSYSLAILNQMANEDGLPFVPWRTWEQWLPGEEYATEDAVYRHYGDKISSGEIEGFVLKDGNLLNWYKWKPVLTTDLIITGFKPGRGKYAGMVGSLELSLASGRVVCNVSGMTDDERQEFTLHQAQYLGKVVEVRYQRQDSAGGLRHPAFIRMRDDKQPHECEEI